MKHPRLFPCLLSAAMINAVPPASAPAQDMTLEQVLIENEDWELVSEGHAFTDGLGADADGNLYFTDVKEGTVINKITPDGAQVAYVSDAPGVSGLEFGPDGRIYACQPRLNRVVAFDSSGKVSILAENVQPNDLVVSHRGDVYFTETRARQVTRIAPDGTVTPAKTEIVRPNGISLSPDQKTLAVSDHGGENVWTLRVKPDGSLGKAQPFMTARTPPETEESRGDGMTTDADGRWYVTSALGIQVFDPEGRLSGIIAKPQEQNLVSVAFAGPDLAYLCAACGDKIYRRKTRTKGILFFQKPE